MLIISDTGDSVVNSEQTFCYDTAQRPDGAAVVAFGPGVNTVLCLGSTQRVRDCLEAICKAHRENWKLLDLREVIGPRPDLSIPQLQIANGAKPIRPVS